MAQAVEFRQYTPPNSRDDLARRIHEVPTEHADAILAACALLQKVHDAGLLSLVSGLLSGGNTIINHLAAVADSKQAVTGLRTALILGSVLNTLDPDALEKAMQPPEDDVPILHIIRGLTTKESRRAAYVGISLLNVFGRALAKVERGQS